MLLVAFALMLPAAAALGEIDRPRILVIVESDSRLPLVQILLRAIEAGLGPEVTEQGEVFIEYLNLLQFSRPAERDLLREFLATRYGGTDLSAIAVIGPNALAFLRENRQAIAPDAPVVYGGLSPAALEEVLGGAADPAMSGVTNAFDIRATLELALAVQRNATEIVVLTGSATFDRQWRSAAAELLGDRYAGLPVRFIPEGTAEDMLAKAARLDPRAVVLYLSVFLDADGNRFIPAQFAQSLAAATPAPVWTISDTMLGTGIVGGHVEDLDIIGRAIAAMLLSAVDGAPLPPPQEVGGGPAVDWRAMRRHGLDVRSLPEETRILHHEPTLWERYRLPILVVATIIAAQAVTIAALVVHRRRLVRSQATLASERAQLTHVSRNLRLGQLSAALAHEINQPLAAIQANADAGARLAGRTPPDQAEIGAIFGDIASDVGRAAAIIANLRRLIVKGETTFDTVDLNEIVSATLSLAANELAARGAQIRAELAPERLEVRGNGPQLQQIVLNLAFNAAEAMADLPEADRIVRVQTARQPDGSRTLAVADVGPGVPADRRADVFRPFVTSKTTGLGVGLAICRNIAEAHGGTLEFIDAETSGARILLTLPPPQAAA
jgi:signal transduction histidine kinase